MKTTFSRRELYALGEPIGDSATVHKVGGGRIYGMGGGGGGGTTTSTGTTYNTNIPEYAEPYVNTMLSATQKQLFNMDGSEITGFKPYNPYSENASDYVAPFSPLQEKAINTASSPQAFGREVGGYMSPYMQNVVDIQKREAMRGAGIMGAQQQAQASNAGAFGGYREGIQRSENMRNLGTQMNDIQLKGQQMAYDDAVKQARTNQQLQMQYGQMQQSQEQQKINQKIQDYANAQQYPLMQLGVMSNMLRGLPMQAATTNQYVAAPNPITQGIGLAGAGASIYNATKGASGGLPREFKYAEGGITSIDDTTRDPNDRPEIRDYMDEQNNRNATRFDVGGEVEAQLESMAIPDLMKQAQESSSPTVRAMAKRILREKQMEAGAGQPAAQGVGPTGPMGVDYQAPQMAGGGIIAFAEPTRENNQSLVTDDSFEAREARRAQDAAFDAETARQSNAATTALIKDIESGKYVPQETKFSNEPAVATAVAPAPVVETRALEGIKAAPVVEPKRVAVEPAVADAQASSGTGIKTVVPVAAERSRGIVTEPVVPAAAPVAAPAPAAPAPAAEEKMPVFTGPLAEFKEALWKAEREAKRSDAEYLKQVKEGTPENTAAAEYRKQVMEERANSKDEAQRQRWMRAAQFFAKWGSTPGPTLAAGLSALDKSMPDIITDEQGYKKAKRELDKVIYDIDQATRAEELGHKKEARALKEKAADRALQLNHYLIQAEAALKGHEISAEATKYSADQSLKGHQATAGAMARSRAEQDATRIQQMFTSAVANRQHEDANIAKEKQDPTYVAAKKMLSYTPKSMTEAMRKQRTEAQTLVNGREAGWTKRIQEADDFVDLYRKQALPVFEKRGVDTGKGKETPAPGAKETPAAAPAAPAKPAAPAAPPPKPANYPDAQWSEKENAYVVPRKGRGGVTNWVKLVPTE